MATGHVRIVGRRAARRGCIAGERQAVSRVNVDSSLESDPRFLLVCRDLSTKPQWIAGELQFVWRSAYELRTPFLSEDEIDLRADRPGFARALIRRGLASDTPEGVRL